MIPVVISIVLIAIIAYFALRLIGDLIKIAIIIGIILAVFYFSYGYLPNFSTNHYTGYLSKILELFPNTSKFTEKIYKIEIVSVARTSSGLLISVKNVGYLPVSGFSVSIDGKNVVIKNEMSDEIKPGDINVIEVGWTTDYKNITVRTNQAVTSLRVK